MNALQSAVYSLVKLFVERQKIALAITKELRPHFFATTGEELRRPSKEYLRATYKGYWGKDHEWEYFFHGEGCRLIHTITQESIDWDSPDVQRFDPYWFAYWVEWWLRQNDDAVAQIIMSELNNQNDGLRNLLFGVLKQLHQLEMLRFYPDRTNMYELIATDQAQPYN